MTEFMTLANGRKLAFNRTAGKGPGVVFLGGFKSDMGGSKAMFLEEWARAAGRAFLRFDYSGHGESSGDFEEGAIGDWAADARAVIAAQTEGPQIFVGSSMGGWISLLLARAGGLQVAGLVGIAAAPDFTTRLWENEMHEAARAIIMRDGRIEVPSGYADFPYVFTRKLFEDGARNRVLDQPLALPFAVRLLQGTADREVPVSVATELLAHIDSPDLQLTLVQGADHRFSSPPCLALLAQTLDALCAQV